MASHGKSEKSFVAGFIVVASLAAEGLLLQLAVGPMDWDALAFPRNAILLTAFITILAIASIWRDSSRVLRWLASLEAAVPSLLAVGAVTAIYGLTGNRSTLSNWSFILLYLFLTVSLGLTCIKRLSFKPKNIPFLLNHIGLFIVLVSATLGSADREELRMIVGGQHPEWRAVDDKGFGYTPGFSLRLDDFSEETFTSEISVFEEDRTVGTISVSVNHPVELGGWTIYQSGYDDYGEGTVTILELVRDPWLPAVYCGIFLLLAGAVSLFLTRKPARR